MRARLAMLLVAATVAAAHAWTFVEETPPDPASARPGFTITVDGDPVTASLGRTFRLDAVSGALEWRASAGTFEAVFALTTLASGHVVAAGRAGAGDFRVVAYDAASGTASWTYTHPTGVAFARDVATTPDGDVVASGSSAGGTLVVRVDGATGASMWSFHDPALISGGEVDLDPAGNVFFMSGSRLVKLDGATGAVLLNVDTTPPGCLARFTHRLLVHPSGDVIRVGYDGCATLGARRFDVSRLDGTTGVEEWTYVRAETSEAQHVGLHPNGTVIVAGTREDAHWLVAALPASGGAPVWEHVETLPDVGYAALVGLSLDATGDVALVGTMDRVFTLQTVGLNGTTGAHRWSRRLQDTHAGAALGIRHTADGDVLVSGAMGRRLSPTVVESRLIVRRMRAADGDSFVGTRCGAAVCGRCERCDAPDVCSVGPHPDCWAPFTDGSALQLRAGTTPSADRLRWSWGKGVDNDAAWYDDPPRKGDETLCVFQDVAGAPSEVVSSTVGAFEDCGKKPCWSGPSGPPTKPSWGFKQTLETPAGKSTVTIKMSAGTNGRSRLQWTAKGAAVGLPPLGLTTPVSAELRSSSGFCWAGRYDANVDRNTPAEFKAKSGP
jgi:outer membrane protein assembly factor BamB